MLDWIRALLTWSGDGDIASGDRSKPFVYVETLRRDRENRSQMSGALVAKTWAWTWAWVTILNSSVFRNRNQRLMLTPWSSKIPALADAIFRYISMVEENYRQSHYIEFVVNFTIRWGCKGSFSYPSLLRHTVTSVLHFGLVNFAGEDSVCLIWRPLKVGIRTS